MAQRFIVHSDDQGWWRVWDSALGLWLLEWFATDGEAQGRADALNVRWLARCREGVLV